MFSEMFLESTFFQWVVLPALIFLARVVDVSLDTIRIMLFSKGKKYLVPIIGFFQVLVWLLAVRQIVLNLSNAACFIAFAAGFAIGSLVGILIEERLAIGYQVIRVITKKEGHALFAALQTEGFGATSIDAEGAKGKVNVLFTIIRRTDIPTVLEMIERYNPNAFYTIEEIRSVKGGGYPVKHLKYTKA